jgi:hypothetical protein
VKPNPDIRCAEIMSRNWLFIDAYRPQFCNGAMCFARPRTGWVFEFWVFLLVKNDVLNKEKRRTRTESEFCLKQVNLCKKFIQFKNAFKLEIFAKKVCQNFPSLFFQQTPLKKSKLLTIFLTLLNFNYVDVFS